MYFLGPNNGFYIGKMQLNYKPISPSTSLSLSLLFLTLRVEEYQIDQNHIAKICEIFKEQIKTFKDKIPNGRINEKGFFLHALGRVKML